VSSLTLERRSSSGSQLTTHKWGTVVEALLLVGICFALIAETSGRDSKQALTSADLAQSLSRLSAITHGRDGFAIAADARASARQRARNSIVSPAAVRTSSVVREGPRARRLSPLQHSDGAAKRPARQRLGGAGRARGAVPCFTLGAPVRNMRASRNLNHEGCA